MLSMLKYVKVCARSLNEISLYLALLHNRPNQLHRLKGIELVVFQQSGEIVQDGRGP